MAAMRDLISSFDKIRSRRAFSTFKILPRSGKIACVCRSRPCFADPPADSPSTINSSDSAGDSEEQSASFPGSTVDSSTVFLRVISRAFLAASRARLATSAF